MHSLKAHTWRLKCQLIKKESLADLVFVFIKDIFKLLALSAYNFNMNLTITVITSLTSEEDKNLSLDEFIRPIYSSNHGCCHCPRFQLLLVVLWESSFMMKTRKLYSHCPLLSVPLENFHCPILMSL